MKHLYSLIVGLTLSSFMSAQYTLDVESTSYQEIENGTSITNGIVWEEIEGVMPLGFDFNLYDYTLNTLIITSATTESMLIPADGLSQVAPAISAAIAEYADRNSVNFDNIGQPGGFSDVSYTTIGEAGERIFILQYQNVGFEDEIWDNNASNDYVNFQVWLYEGTNVIAFHFGPSEINHPASSFYEVSGPAIGLFRELEFSDFDFLPRGTSHFILGNTENPILSAQTGEEIMSEGNIFFTGVPADGTKLYLIPEGMSTNTVNSKEDTFTLLNNPVSNTLILNTIENIEDVEIYNMEGKNVLSEKPQSVLIDIDSLNQGVYIMVIKTKDAFQSIKFIKK